MPGNAEGEEAKYGNGEVQGGEELDEEVQCPVDEVGPQQQQQGGPQRRHHLRSGPVARDKGPQQVQQAGGGRCGAGIVLLLWRGEGEGGEVEDVGHVHQHSQEEGQVSPEGGLRR
eukprot:GILI01032003.1.p2 GENE.GILI01032003.1~~GILI01032003.1.p2  ORF type:complete len:115 (+),score=22.85 GILI01032003.1:555-899(+)